MIDVAAKSRALFLTRSWAQGERDRSLTVELLNVWALLSSRTNPPHVRVTLETWNAYAFIFTNDRIWKARGKAKHRGHLIDGCITPCEFKSTTENKPRDVRIMQLQPVIDWPLVWENLHNVRLSDGARSAWYMVIHDIIPTNARLHRIRLMHTNNCTQCERQDTMLHRLKGCGVGQDIWEWTRTRIARIRRTDPRRVPTEWLLRLCFQLYYGFWRIWFFIWCINVGPCR